MSFLTKVITDTSPDFGDNPQIVTENGQPASVDVENLISNTGYWTKAEIWQNGVLNDTSSVENFQTLPAGTITLTHHSSVRDRYDYIVTYTYTSTYALSSSVLRCGASVSSQGVISGNTITFTVSGLVPGDAYLSQITTIDMYGESAQTMLTLIMPVMHYVGITDTNATNTTVECELDYVIDGTFTQGYVEWWNSTDDPSTDQPQGHNYFVDGADTCTVSGLTEGTTYKFRATIFYDDVESTVSNVATADTTTDYTMQYFTIQSDDARYMYISVVANSNGLSSNYQPIYYSLDDGSSWTALQKPTTTAQQIGPVQEGRKILMKHTGPMSESGALVTIKFAPMRSIRLSGNIASLCFGDNFTGTKTMPDYAYAGLFMGNSTSSAYPIYIDAQNLSFASYTAVSNYGLQFMFQNCEYLTSLPDLSSITSVGEWGMNSVFSGCTSLTTAPDLSHVTSVAGHGLAGALQLCTSLTTPPDLRRITSIGDYGMYYMFQGCSALRTAPDLRGITTIANSYGMHSMFRDCISLTTPPDLSNITSIGITYGMYAMFSGCTSLTTAPVLRGITRTGTNGMQNMFRGCTALTTAPDLRQITDVRTNGITSMFNGCRNLTTAYAPTITWDTSKTQSWLDGVAASGTLYADASIIESIPENNISGCPSGWTKERL